jgi:hypothetical protein
MWAVKQQIRSSTLVLPAMAPLVCGLCPAPISNGAIAMKKRSRPKICNASPLGNAEPKNEPTDHPAVVREQGGERTKRAWRSCTILESDWARRERNRGRLKDALSADQEISEATGRTEPKSPETAAESKYEPTDYERTVLAKQAQRLKDQIRVPRIKFVEDHRGGRLEFDHPDQTIALALLREAFGTADDQFAYGQLHRLCEALPVDENSPLEYPRADDLNRAISGIAAGRAVDEFHAEILTDLAVCRIIQGRLLHNLREPVRFHLSKEMMFAVEHYKYDPKDQIDKEVKIDNRPVLEFSVRSATKLMKLCVELMDAANRYRATFESSRKVQTLSAVTPGEAIGEIKYPTSRATPEKPNGAGPDRLNGSAVHQPPQKTNSTLARKTNGHASA